MNPGTEPAKIRKSDLEGLIAERERIEAFLAPPPPPPPDPEKEFWKAAAIARKAEIDEALQPYFFPKPKEGVQRKSKAGFVAMMKCEVERKLDVAALADVIAKCQEVATKECIEIDVESKVIAWKPGLKLTEYRELPEEIRHTFEHALIIKDKAPKFEIVREGTEPPETNDSENSEEND